MRLPVVTLADCAAIFYALAPGTEEQVVAMSTEADFRDVSIHSGNGSMRGNCIAGDNEFVIIRFVSERLSRLIYSEELFVVLRHIRCGHGGPDGILVWLRNLW